MHDAGFVHRDLGNTNILLERDGPGRWRDLRIVDLNRGETSATVGPREHARDLSGLALPSHLRRLFMRMYWNSLPPEGMERWASTYVRLHRWWVQSRRLRHPIREGRLRRAALSQGVKARTPRDLWIWDERPASRSRQCFAVTASRTIPHRARCVWWWTRSVRRRVCGANIDRCWTRLSSGPSNPGRIGVAVERPMSTPTASLNFSQASDASLHSSGSATTSLASVAEGA